MSGDIYLTIDRIVLHGMDHIDRFALADALQQALSEQLFPVQAMTAAERSRFRADILLPTTFSAEQLGQSLGQTLSSIISDSGGGIDSGQEPQRGGRRHD